MRRFHQLDALSQAFRARRYVVVARDDQAFKRRIGRPQRFDGLRHRATRLACADDDGAAFDGVWRLGQERSHVVQWQCSAHGGGVEVFEEGAGFTARVRCGIGHGVGVSLAVITGVSGRHCDPVTAM